MMLRTHAVAAAILLSPFFLSARIPSSPVPGAPAQFRVTQTTIECTADGAASTLKISYELKVIDPVCGWICAQFTALPIDWPGQEAVIMIDAERIPAKIRREHGILVAGMDPFNTLRVPKKLKKAKSVRLVLTFTGAEVNGAVDLLLDAPSSYLRQQKVQPSLGTVSASVHRVQGIGLTSMNATFADVRPGSTLSLRNSAGNASVSIKPRSKK